MAPVVPLPPGWSSRRAVVAFFVLFAAGVVLLVLAFVSRADFELARHAGDESGALAASLINVSFTLAAAGCVVGAFLVRARAGPSWRARVWRRGRGRREP